MLGRDLPTTVFSLHGKVNTVHSIYLRVIVGDKDKDSEQNMFSTKKEIEEFLSNKILLRTESSHLKIFPDRLTYHVHTYIFSW